MMGSIVDDAKKMEREQAQRDLLIDYIGENFDMLVGDDNVLDDYVGHEISADGETITVRLKIRKKSPPGQPKNFALTKQRVIKRADIIAFHKSRTTIDKANVPDKPSITHQVSWADQRSELLSTADGRGVSDAYLKVIQRYVKADTVQPPANMHPKVYVDTLTCSCVNVKTGPTLCEHLRFVYVTGWEREALIEGSTNHCILMPIGMGYTWTPVHVHHDLDDEAKPTGMVTISDYKRSPEASASYGPLRLIAEEVTAYPEESDQIKLGPGESLIKAIRYFEDMIKATDKYNILRSLAADDGNVIGKAAQVCSRKHNRPVDRALMAQFQAGIRFGNPHRDNWLVACAFTAKVHNLCLPCYDATSASNNVPVF